MELQIERCVVKSLDMNRLETAEDERESFSVKRLGSSIVVTCVG